MTRRFAAFCLAVFCSLLPLSGFCRDDAGDVYEAVTASAAKDCPIVVASRTDIRGIDDTLARRYSQLLDSNHTLADSFAAANRSAHRIPWKPINTQVVFLDTTAAGGDDGDAALLAAANRDHPCARYVYSFSAVAVSQGDAMVKVNRFCGSLCGGGSDIVRLHVIRGRWTVVKWSALGIN